MTAISGDTAAANNAESFFDGTGYAGTGNTIPTVTTVGTVTTLTGHTAQTGDNFARLGAPAGASVSADIAALPTAGENADQVWEEAIADHSGTVGSTAEQLAAAGAGGDPWDTAIPAAYAAGKAGYILGNLEDDFWSSSTRTLTQSAASVVSAVSGSTLTITRGDTFTATITGLGSIATRTRLYFTVKTDPASQADSAAIIQIEESDGLKYLNGAAASVAGQGSITVDDEDAGDITIVLAAAASDDLAIRSMTYDVQMVTATAVTTLTSATCTVAKDVTRAVA